MPRPTRKLNPPVVVTELGISSLGIARSLGKRGVHVIGIDSKLSNYGALSKYCTPVFCTNVNNSALIETLLNLGKAIDQKAVLMPASDMTVAIISKHRRDLNQFYNFVLPSNEVIATLSNKRLFHEFALKNGFCVPQTLFTNSPQEVKIVAETIAFPCVIKPQVRDECWYQRVPGENKVILASTKSEYFRIIKQYDICDIPLIVQEWIHGSDPDVYFCLAYMNKNCRPLAVFTGKKVRQHPIETGVTSMAQSLWHPFIAQESLRLLELCRCQGFCSVEFKFCHRDKVYKITEPTIGRPDLQEALSVKAGVDIHYIAYLDAIGIDCRATSTFKQRVKWICEPMEIYSLPHYLKLKRCRLRDLVSSYAGPRSYALMDLDDFKPFLLFFVNEIKRKFRSFYRRSFLSTTLKL